MKVALLTIWHEKNYGAELQAYATVKMLQQLGHQVEIINIYLSDSHMPNFKGRISSFVSSFGPAEKKFQEFWKRHMPVTRRYRSSDELMRFPPQADIYLVGSDQVWNPDLTGEFEKLFFLDFARDDVRRISYSSSFGTSEWHDEKNTDEIKKLLTKFDYISCRERSGVSILKETFGLSAHLTVDPTLLFSQYPELTGPLHPRRTFVYYPLSEDPELTGYARTVASELGLEPLNNKKATTLFGHIVWDSVSIEDWVRNIGESEFVLTRSFHGLVFSLLYEKPFAIIASKNNRSTRILSLLEQLGMSERYFDSFQACTNAQPWRTPIDYSEVRKRIDSFRTESINYLKMALR